MDPYRKAFKILEARYKLLQLLGDLDIESAENRRVAAWQSYMSFLSEHIGSKAW